MHEYLIGMTYHYPKDYDNWIKGIVEDYEASTAIFIYAENEEQALNWGEVVARALFRHVNPVTDKVWDDFYYDCWVEDIRVSSWSPIFGFFQHINVGIMPDISMMTSEAYIRWYEENKN